MRLMIAREMEARAEYYVEHHWEEIFDHLVKYRLIENKDSGVLWRRVERLKDRYLNYCVRMTPDEARAEGANPKQTWGGMVEIDAFAQLTGLVVNVYMWTRGVESQSQSPKDAMLGFFAKPIEQPEGDVVSCNLVQSATHFEYITQEPPLEVFYYHSNRLYADGTRPPIRKASDAAPQTHQYNSGALRANGTVDVGFLSRARGQQQPGQAAAPVVDPEAAKRTREELEKQQKEYIERRKRERAQDGTSWLASGAKSEASGQAYGPRRHYRSIAEIARLSRERQAAEDEQYMQRVVLISSLPAPP